MRRSSTGFPDRYGGSHRRRVGADRRYADPTPSAIECTQMTLLGLRADSGVAPRAVSAAVWFWSRQHARTDIGSSGPGVSGGLGKCLRMKRALRRLCRHRAKGRFREQQGSSRLSCRGRRATTLLPRLERTGSDSIPITIRCYFPQSRQMTISTKTPWPPIEFPQATPMRTEPAFRPAE
jgi:hypothetical protein